MKWIKISEKLPKVGESVLWANSDKVIAGVLTHIRNEYTKKLIVYVNPDEKVYNLEDVTHWVPFPLPPK